MTPLVISVVEEARAAEIVAHAEKNRMNFEMMKEIDKGFRPAAGDTPAFQMCFPMGFIVAFSIEQQPEPIGWCRHISMSVREAGRVPNPVALDMVISLFGFRGSVFKKDDWIHIWEEPCGPGKIAVNLLQKYEPAGKS